MRDDSATRSPKRLIVNADDFGRSPGVNKGIVQAYEQGLVTSASLMVRWPDAAEAAAYGRGHQKLSLGLHVDLGEWDCRGGTWVPVYEVVPEDSVAAVEDEVYRQLAAFRRLMGRDPTHIDSHQHRHLSEPVRSLFVMIANQLVVPLRGCTPDIRYCGNFYGQTKKGLPYPEAVSVEALVGIISELPEGITELCCHPGQGNDLVSMYCGERAREVKTLCDPRVLSAIVTMGIELRSFSDLAACHVS